LTILDQLAAYAALEATRATPPDVTHHAKRAVLDWLAALYPGTQVAPATNLVRAHPTEVGHGTSSLPGFGTTAFPSLAAWINGSASHAVEFDDIFRDAIYHPGCPVISAALAIGEARNCNGKEFLAAIVAGYEISTRIGEAVQPSHYRFFHTTGTVGCLGAAAAAITLLRPGDAVATGHALANATTFASGLQQAMRSDAMTKALHAGNAASVGVRVAQAAAEGVTGAADMLEGAAGFGAAMASQADWSRATHGLGQRYNIMNMTHKAHACCGHTFAAIDAALVLRARHDITPERIRSIDVSTYQTALDVTGNFDPKTAFEAKFSLPYVVSHALVHGAVRLDAFDPAHLKNPAARSLMCRFSLHADAKITQGFPTVRSARVTITLNDGMVCEAFAPHRRGDPEAPLSDAELNAKFEELVSPVIGRDRALHLRDLVWTLEMHALSDLQLARP
jgi:2-methylcitrate dehydratase PrpD